MKKKPRFRTLKELFDFVDTHTDLEIGRAVIVDGR